MSAAPLAFESRALPLKSRWEEQNADLNEQGNLHAHWRAEGSEGGRVSGGDDAGGGGDAGEGGAPGVCGDQRRDGERVCGRRLHQGGGDDAADGEGDLFVIGHDREGEGAAV